MPVICRLLAQPSAKTNELGARPEQLEEAVQSSKRYTDVYRYWDGIRFLLARTRPGSHAGNWLDLGARVSTGTSRVPGARIIAATEVEKLHGELQSIAPEDLAPHYDATDLDDANVYPSKWREWEETFDPLGQVLEHYTFLQSIASDCAAEGHALLLFFIDD